MDFEEIWEMREEHIYPALFGGKGRGIFVLTHEHFQQRFPDQPIGATWLFNGVFEFAPTIERPFWTYVTSGYSNPWYAETFDPTGVSGNGVEFVFATTEQGDWAIRFLQNMLAFDLVLGTGVIGSGPLGPGDRIPLRAPINGVDECLLRNAVVAEAEAPLPSGFSLPSGHVTFLSFTGVTDAEIAYAKEHGSDALLKILRDAKLHPVSDPGRQSIVA